MALPFKSLHTISQTGKTNPASSGSALSPTNIKAVTSVNNILHPTEKTTAFNHNSVHGTAKESKIFGSAAQLVAGKPLNSPPPSSSPKAPPRLMV